MHEVCESMNVKRKQYTKKKKKKLVQELIYMNCAAAISEDLTLMLDLLTSCITVLM